MPRKKSRPIGRQPALPFDRRAYDDAQVVVSWPPAKALADQSHVSDEARRVARAPWCGSQVETDSRLPFHGLEDLAHGIAVTVAAVQREVPGAGIQVPKGLDVGLGEVRNMDVIADAGAVGGLVILAENLHMVAPADGGLAGDLYEMGGVRG